MGNMSVRKSVPLCTASPAVANSSGTFPFLVWKNVESYGCQTRNELRSAERQKEFWTGSGYSRVSSRGISPYFYLLIYKCLASFSLAQTGKLGPMVACKNITLVPKMRNNRSRNIRLNMAQTNMTRHQAPSCWSYPSSSSPPSFTFESSYSEKYA